MANFWKIVNSIIAKSDILIIVLDARLVFQTRNLEVEEKIEKSGKEIVFVINKSDLVSKGYVERIKDEFGNCVFMSAKEHLGTNVLRREIMRVAKGKEVTVGVLGYPNTGKSSVINALSGKGSAKVAPVSGQTRGMQLVRVSGKIMMTDSPGVIPFMEKDEVKHLLIGSMNPQNAKDADIAAEKVIEISREIISKVYSVEISLEDNEYDILGKIGYKLNYLKKGGQLDIRRVSVKIIDDWQKGKII